MSKRGTRSAHPGIRRVGPKEYVVRVVMRDPTSRKQRELERRFESVTMADAVSRQAEMREELKKLLTATAINPKKRGDGARQTLTDFAKRWVAHAEAAGRRRVHVVDKDLDTLDRHILPYLGSLALKDIDVQVLVGWMAVLGRSRKPNGRPYARATLHGAWSLVYTMLRDAVPLAGLMSNPARDLRFEVKGAAPTQKASLEREEVERFLAAAVHENPDVRAMMWVGFTTGMRFGEITALRWRDIDFAQKRITVARSQVYGNVGLTKTENHRTTPLHDDVAQVLKEHQAWCERINILSPEVGLVFPSTRGTYRTPAVLRRAMERCAVRASIEKHVTPHTMRRTFNNLTRRAAGDIVARSMTGHVTEAMTEHYSHVGLLEKEEAVARALGADLAARVKAAGDARWGSGGSGVDPQQVDRAN